MFKSLYKKPKYIMCIDSMECKLALKNHGIVKGGMTVHENAYVMSDKFCAYTIAIKMHGTRMHLH
ncbi:hypothetical protein D3K18_14870 [Escherichia coli]|nr:hypothetical protein [Escherichia coli]EEV6091778.1 hypothetical protein [Escherichia coli]EFN9559779.1 hypothetical protein [Escherichia coli]EFO1526011.1 hypothetical protein [Escherichia coli]OEN89926.1 hypothetical protein BHF59_24065 [Escherichia coli]